MSQRARSFGPYLRQVSVPVTGRRTAAADNGAGARRSTHSAPAGAVTRDEISNPNALGIKTVLNSEVMQDWNTDDAVFDVLLISFSAAARNWPPG